MPRSNRCRETDSYRVYQVCFHSCSFKMKKNVKNPRLAARHSRSKQWGKYLVAHVGELKCPLIAPSISATFGFTTHLWIESKFQYSPWVASAPQATSVTWYAHSTHGYLDQSLHLLTHPSGLRTPYTSLTLLTPPQASLHLLKPLYTSLSLLSPP